jgi:hypothetical protein
MEFRSVYSKEVMDFKKQIDEYRDYLIESFNSKLHKPLITRQVLCSYYEITGLTDREKGFLKKDIQIL